MKTLEQILQQWRGLKLDEVLDFDKFNQYAIVHHSTTIEGSTLTETEVQLLLSEGITPKGKPLVHSLMTIDHLDALSYILKAADEKEVISPKLVSSINARVMRQTGSIYQTALGTVDGSSGEYLKGNVRAGNSYFVNYDKVPDLVDKLFEGIREGITTLKTDLEKLFLSFDTHFDLVTIHPFYDGNGRTSRLFMNFIQRLFGLPLGIVFKEDKADYFDALVETREKEDLAIFRQFMLEQYIRFLQLEIEHFNQSQKPGAGSGGFSIVF